MNTKFYVRMTDKFMSGWGPAKNATNVLVIECDTMAQAEAIEAAAHKRPEMKYIGVYETKPKARRGVIYSHSKFADMSGPWLQFYKSEALV